jgi:thienamycin biosynthesis protein ThnO
LFNSAHASRLNQLIEDYISSGEVQDITMQVRNSPRMIAFDGKTMFLPTVLFVKQNKSQAFGWELPFPFVTIAAAADEEEMMELSKNTLILSVLSQDRELIHRLCSESSIRKVFAASQAERGYNYMDPHEGYMADFLYHKKAVAY